MTRVAVLGYVNVDHVVGLTGDVEPGMTALVQHRHTPLEGRLGGCPSYIATGLTSRGIDAAVVSTIGDDEPGRVIERALADAGVDTRGLHRNPDVHTGVSWLPYAPSGASYCVYDPGGELPASLTEAQHQICSAAHWLVATAGPPGPCLEALDLLPQASSVFWAVKGDPLSFPEPLAFALARRAAVVVFSSEEAAFLARLLGNAWRTEPGLADALLVETHGAEGARFWTSGDEHWLPLDAPLPVSDTIGAGDRFCAGLLAALIDDAAPEAAVAAGAELASALLGDRGRAPVHDDDEMREADATARVVSAGDA